MIAAIRLITLHADAITLAAESFTITFDIRRHIIIDAAFSCPIDPLMALIFRLR
jgi:hypothetical protein